MNGAVHVTCTSGITNEGLLHLIGLKVQSLVLNGCENVTDAGLAYLSELPLWHLAIVDCPNVSDEGLGCLNQVPLQKLEVVDCPLISDDTLPLFGNFRADHQQVYEPSPTPVVCVAHSNNDLVQLRHICSVQIPAGM
jgi:hypothetical protein